MLDMNYPGSAHVIRAMHLVGDVTNLAYAMTVASSSVRLNLLQESIPRLEAVRKHNIDHFGADLFIAQAIDEYEAGLRKLAALGNGQILEDRRDGEGNCPYCDRKISKYPLNRERTSFIILCGQCDDLFRPALDKLHSLQGFGIEAI